MINPPPSNCPRCGGEREWAAPGVADCFFCGTTQAADEQAPNLERSALESYESDRTDSGQIIPQDL